jgi:hypothetical protein
MRTAFACAAIVFVSVFTAGCGDDSSDAGAPPTTTETTAPAGTLPTSESVKLAIFERSYSECASTELNALKAKYKLRDTTDQVLATGVALAWIKYFKGGQDAFPDGRDGCLAGLKDRNK